MTPVCTLPHTLLTLHKLCSYTGDAAHTDTTNTDTAETHADTTNTGGTAETHGTH